MNISFQKTACFRSLWSVICSHLFRRKLLYGLFVPFCFFKVNIGEVDINFVTVINYVQGLMKSLKIAWLRSFKGVPNKSLILNYNKLTFYPVNFIKAEAQTTFNQLTTKYKKKNPNFYLLILMTLKTIFWEKRSQLKVQHTFTTRLFIKCTASSFNQTNRNASLCLFILTEHLDEQYI